MRAGWQEAIEKLPIATDRPVIGYGAAVIACGLGLALRLIVGQPLGGGYPFITFVPAVVVTAFFFGPRPGILAGVLSWFTARFFCIQPIHSFELTLPVAASIPFYGLVVAVDIAIIHFMQRANRELREQREQSHKRTEQRDVMFQELQHRVSNKLQIIASLLTLQRRMVADPVAQKALDDAALRVGMIGRISRALHDPRRAGLGVAAFLDQVGRDIIEASGAQDVTLRVDAEPGVEFADGAGVPIALIICETISNALEHGFRSSGRGAIAISVKRSEGAGTVVTVTNDGDGVDEDFDAANAPSLGMRIATTLARQLDGSYSLRPAPERGTIAELRISA